MQTSFSFLNYSDLFLFDFFNLSFTIKKMDFCCFREYEFSKVDKSSQHFIKPLLMTMQMHFLNVI